MVPSFDPKAFGSNINAWLASDDIGLSSSWMAATMFGRVSRLGCEYHYPRDADDFGRCHRFVLACGPFTLDQWEALADSGIVWARIVAAWQELCAMLDNKEHKKLTKMLEGFAR